MGLAMLVSCLPAPILSHRKPMYPHLPLDLAEALAQLEAVLGNTRSSLEEDLVVGPGRGSKGDGIHQSSHRRRIRREGLRRLDECVHVRRIPRTRHGCLGTTTAKKMRIDLMTLLRENCRQQHLVHHCGHDRTFAKSRHGWRKTPRRVQERELLLQRPRRQLAESDLRLGETCRSSRTTGSEIQGREDQGRRGILRLGRKLHADTGQLRLSCTPLPPIQSWWSLVSALVSFLGGGTRELTKFVSDAAASARRTSRRRRIPVPASPRHRRAGIVVLFRVVSYGSAMEVRALPTRLLSRYQRVRLCRCCEPP